MRALALAFILLLPSLGMAQAVSPQDAALLHRVGELFEVGDSSQARDLLRERMREDENPPPVLLQALGNALYLTDDLAGAYAAYGRALEADPDNQALCRNLALTAYGLERYAESAALFERAHALAGDKADIALLHQATTAWSQAERFHEAARVLDAAWPLLPGPDISWLKLNALVWTSAGQHGKGIAAIHQALDAAPGNRELWLLLADAETRGDRYGRAAAALEAALRLNAAGKDAVATDRLAGLYAGAGLPFLAARSLERSTVDAQALDRLAGLYALAGRPGQALRALESAQQRAPKAQRTKRMALICCEFGLHARAETLFKRYLQAAPGDQEARMLLARTAMNLGNMETVRQTLQAIPPDSDYHDTAQAWLKLLD